MFLHPETGEEYALARTERKTGTGYHGFSTVYDSGGESLNPKLFEAFVKLGYDPGEDYSVGELLQVFQQITQ